MALLLLAAANADMLCSQVMRVSALQLLCCDAVSVCSHGSAPECLLLLLLYATEGTSLWRCPALRGPPPTPEAHCTEILLLRSMCTICGEYQLLSTLVALPCTRQQPMPPLFSHMQTT
jgi:hypothetical protein